MYIGIVAISYVSESGDHYLSLYSGTTLKDVVEKEKIKYDYEFGRLYIKNVECLKSNIKSRDVMGKSQQAIEDSRDG